MGIGPLVAVAARLAALARSARSSGRSASRSPPASWLIALGGGSSKLGLITYTFAAFVTASIVLEFVRGTRARHALTGGSWVVAFGGLVARNRRRYGGYVVHAAIVLLAVGIAGSSLYQTVREQKLQRGQSMTVAGYTLAYRSFATKQGPNSTESRALLAVSRGKSSLGTLSPGQELLPGRAADLERGRDPRRTGPPARIST